MHRSNAVRGAPIAFVIALIAGCGSFDDDGAVSTSSVGCDSARYAGAWAVVTNNATVPPGGTTEKFFSYNQPSLNSSGMVVFRGRARTPTGGSGGGGGSSGVLRGIYARDVCSNAELTRVADTSTLVPDPNSNAVAFTEFPSIPRIDRSSSLIATRGTSQPVWTLGDGTKAGTAGIFVQHSGALKTGVNLLGNVPGFEAMSVPGATAATKFDQFPGSPATTAEKYVVFKGNYTDGTGKTGIYFRDVTTLSSPVRLIANTATVIPNQPGGGTATFGSTAPPSAVGNDVVFAGFDNESSPTLGGIYKAPLGDSPALQTLVSIGDPVRDAAGAVLSDGSTFNRFGEAVVFDGRYIAFWGAWGASTRTITLTCPTDGNADLLAYCNTAFPGGTTTTNVPVDQGIFLYDTSNGRLWMAARSGSGQAFLDFLFWTYSGRPPGAGGESSAGDGGGDAGGDAELPRWRSTAFIAAEGDRGVIFKAVKVPGTGVPANGIYASAVTSSGLASFVKVIELGDSAARIDAAAPAGAVVTAVGIEREAFRNGWLTLTVTMTNLTTTEGWAGIYATYVPSGVQAPVLAGLAGGLGLLLLLVRVRRSVSDDEARRA